MELIEGSFLLRWMVRLLPVLYEKYRQSATYRVLSGLWSRVRSGGVWRFCTRPSALDQRLGESVLLRGALWCLNLPSELLHRLYRKNPALCDGSRLLTLSEHGPLALLCCMAFAMLVTPNPRWNNLYGLAFAGAELLLFWISGMRNPRRRFRLEGIPVWLVIFLLLRVLSAFWSRVPAESLRFVGFAVTSAVVLLVTVNTVETEKQLMALLCAIAAGMAVNTLYAVYQRITGVRVDRALTDVILNAGMPGRVFSFFENPNSYANLLVLFVPLLAVLPLSEKRTLPRLALLLLPLIGLLALVMTYSRSAWIACAASIFLLVLLLRPRYAPLLVVLGMLLFPILPKNITNRILTAFMGDTSVASRGFIYSGALAVIAAAPLLGAGLGTAAARHAVYLAGGYALFTTSYAHAHDIYLQICMESGVPALLSFLLALLYVFQGGVRAARLPGASPRLRRLCAGFAAGLFASQLFGITDYAWSYPRVMVLYWLFAGLMLAAARLARKQDREREDL